jgi:hypothetical protein
MTQEVLTAIANAIRKGAAYVDNRQVKFRVWDEDPVTGALCVCGMGALCIGTWRGGKTHFDPVTALFRLAPSASYTPELRPEFYRLCRHMQHWNDIAGKTLLEIADLVEDYGQ